METNILQLYPATGNERPLRGLYSDENIRDAENIRNAENAESTGNGDPFVYTNYVTSLDGRIAIPGPDGDSQVPSAIANPRDWRLFQELAVQADVLLSSGRYLRDRTKDGAQELAIENNPNLSDLADWRTERGLSPYSDFAVLSQSLDFPIPTSMLKKGRRVLVITSADADAARVQELEDAGIQVFRSNGSTGKDVIGFLTNLGHRFIYNATGPKVNHMLLRDQLLDRLYLTFASRVLGGSPFSTIVEGPTLQPAPGFRLRSLYLDPHALDGDGQLFASYDIQRRTQDETAKSATI